MTPHNRIGTSGWHYKHWKGNFYPAKLPSEEVLRFYARHLDTVEINNSFYRLPTDEAVESWLEQTPRDFLFALKASRYITHDRKLNDPERTIEKFKTMTKGFGQKLGPILLQLPPKWGVNTERSREFLSILPRDQGYAFEFRHPSWQTQPVYYLATLQRRAMYFRNRRFSISGKTYGGFLIRPLAWPRREGIPGQVLRVPTSWVGENHSGLDRCRPQRLFLF